MANHKSAKSRIVRNNKRAVINGARRSRVRTFVKKVEAAILSGNKEQAAAAFKVAELYAPLGGANKVIVLPVVL